jgi:hypothetical protein
MLEEVVEQETAAQDLVDLVEVDLVEHLVTEQLELLILEAVVEVKIMHLSVEQEDLVL